MEEQRNHVKGKMFDTTVISEPLQSSILKVRNKTVYMTGKRYFKVEKFLKHFFAHKNYIDVTSSKLGFAVVSPKKEYRER